MNLTTEIIESQRWGAILKTDGMNPHLGLSTKSWLAWDHISDADKDRLKTFWREQYRARTEIKPGLFKRFPPGSGKYRDGYSTSHDELITGIGFASYLFDNGETARRILDRGTRFGLYFSGHSPYKPIHGKWYAGIINFLGRRIDSEWFVLINPLYRGYMKLVAGRDLNCVEAWAIKLDLAKTKTWNLLNLRLIFLERLGKFKPEVQAARRRMGTGYRGYYRGNSLYKKLFEIMDS